MAGHIATHDKKPKLKPLPPTMREKARYISYEILSQGPLHGNAGKDLVESVHATLGILHGAKAGLIPLDYDEASQRGILRTTSKALADVKAAFALARSLQGIRVIVRSLRTSGTLVHVKQKNPHPTHGA